MIAMGSLTLRTNCRMRAGADTAACSSAASVPRSIAKPMMRHQLRWVRAHDLLRAVGKLTCSTTDTSLATESDIAAMMPGMMKNTRPMLTKMLTTSQISPTQNTRANPGRMKSRTASRSPASMRGPAANRQVAM